MGHQHPTKFRLFRLLPGEIRNHVWKIASSSPQIVKITEQNNNITKINSTLLFLLLACKESYSICLNSKKDRIRIRKGKTVRVDFHVVIFCIDGLGDLTARNRKVYMEFRTVVLILDQAQDISDRFSALPNLQDLWVYTGQPQRICSIPAPGFRYTWQTHHCIEYPEDYHSNGIFTSYGDRRKLCPVCDWRVDLDELGHGAAPRQPTAFRLMLPSSIPLFPDYAEVYRKQSELVFRWVRIDEACNESFPETILGMSKKEAFRASALFYFRKKRGRIVGAEKWIDRIQQQLGNEVCELVE